ncbi:MAG: hypothetical protein AB1489_41250 [Acidobacteriota bacterium]
MPEIVKTVHTQGYSAYESRYAPYVPRDYRDLAALQVLCGDHSERDVTVFTKNKTLARPWLTIWQDLRTGLIWGWYLSLIPSSETASLAYADGILTFGAQPLSRPTEEFYSYIYTDQGRDYRSHDWDDKLIAVHKEAMRIDGGLELLLVERQVGILQDLMVRHILARGYNAKEKPVERVFKDISLWEKDTFVEYCGANPSQRPDAWRQLYQKHRQYEQGKIADSPFIKFDDYQTSLRRFIQQYNSCEHERHSVGCVKVSPMVEFSRLYTTRYELCAQTVSLLLMKSQCRTIRKNGVNCFQGSLIS